MNPNGNGSGFDILNAQVKGQTTPQTFSPGQTEPPQSSVANIQVPPQPAAQQISDEEATKLAMRAKLLAAISNDANKARVMPQSAEEAMKVAMNPLKPEPAIEKSESAVSPLMPPIQTGQKPATPEPQQTVAPKPITPPSSQSNSTAVTPTPVSIETLLQKPAQPIAPMQTFATKKPEEKGPIVIDVPPHIKIPSEHEVVKESLTQTQTQQPKTIQSIAIGQVAINSSPEKPEATPQSPQPAKDYFDSSLTDNPLSKGKVEDYSKPPSSITSPRGAQDNILYTHAEESKDKPLSFGFSTPEKKEEAHEGHIDLPRLRTLETDTAEAVRREHASVISVAVQEAKKKEAVEQGAVVQKSKNTVVIIISSILITLGILTPILFYVTSRNAALITQPKNELSTSLIYAEKRTGIEQLANTTPDQIIEKIKTETSQPKTDNQFEEIIIVRKDAAGKSTPLKAQEFMTLIGAHTPDIVLRTLEDKYMLGIAPTGNGGAPFIIMRTDLFENAFSGMLTWENSLVSDFSRIFPIDISGERNNLTFRKWSDELSQNRQIRDVKDDQGNVILVYYIFDKKSIVITTNTEALQLIIQRLFSVKTTN